MCLSRIIGTIGCMCFTTISRRMTTMLIPNHPIRPAPCCLLVLILLSLTGMSLAETEPQQTLVTTTTLETLQGTTTLETLQGFLKLRNNQKQDIEALNKRLKETQSEAQKQDIKQELAQLEADLQSTSRNFENIAGGVNLAKLRAPEAVKFNLQEEVFALLKPAIDEMKEMTAHVRQKSDLREKIALYQERLPVIEQAHANINRLIQQSQDPKLLQALKTTADNWQKQSNFLKSELRAAQLELEKLMASETSITEASQSYLKSFFQKRGLYLTEALLAVLGIILLSRLSYAAMQRYLPGFRKRHRSFRIRLIELLHRILTILMIILGPMLVFYLVEDWVLFSLGILLLLGIALTLRQTLPRYWHQIQLFLNIGSVREGERILIDGLPWQVSQINVFCTLVNPVADLGLRVPIKELVDLKSRPAKSDEPWFPCRKGDWVILSDGTRGKVIGISPEMVQLVERGGAHLTYQTADFLAASPRNLASNFRLKEILGISYKLQAQCTTKIPEMLDAYIRRRIEQEGYGEQLVNLRVEFAQANSSSLDLAVIADFSGELGDLYNRLRRAIQRWCVDACSEYDWEIPFPQMTLSGAVAGLPDSD